MAHHLEDFLNLRLGELDGQDPVLRGIAAEDVGEGGDALAQTLLPRRHDRLEPVFMQRPHRMLAAGAAAEIVARNQNRGVCETRGVELEVGIGAAVGAIAPVVKQVGAETGARNRLQKLLGDDLVRIDVRAIQRRDDSPVTGERFHRDPHVRISTNCPAIAAAAAISGLTRCVRPPLPWRPSKFRFDVEAHRSPGASWSGFIPRHMLQPDWRHSHPAARKTASSPSASACRRTCWEPGTTSTRTPAATLRPSKIPAASRKSSMRALVQLPIKTAFTAISVIGVPGVSPMYASVRSTSFRA